ncbi:MAG: hypothetical protein NVS3B12_35370 [Acidimicrobiales bacterium]
MQMHSGSGGAGERAEIERFVRGALRSWARPTPGHWIRIRIDNVSGRRLSGY